MHAETLMPATARTSREVMFFDTASPTRKRDPFIEQRRRLESTNADGNQGIAARVDTAVTLLPALVEPTSDQVINVFLCNTVMQAKTGSSTSSGHFSGLMALVKSTPLSEALPYSLEAAALASLATRLCNHQLRLRAMRRYTTAVRLLRKTDFDLSTNIPSMIASILLLSIYEVRCTMTCRTPLVNHTLNCRY